MVKKCRYELSENNKENEQINTVKGKANGCLGGMWSIRKIRCKDIPGVPK